MECKKQINDLELKPGGMCLTDVPIKVENIVASATLGKSIELPKVALTLEGVEYNSEKFPGLVYKLKEPKTAALIFGSGKLVGTGAKTTEDSIKSLNIIVDKMRVLDEDIPQEFEITIQNIVASANLEKTLNLEAVALDLENTEYEPEQFPGLVYRLEDPKVVLLLFGSGKVVCTGAKNIDNAQLGVEKTKERLGELDLI
jgi:transcription initiation factor TFIID TATA-box-binding protein